MIIQLKRSDGTPDSKYPNSSWTNTFPPKLVKAGSRIVLKNAFIESQIDKDYGKIELTEDLTLKISFAYYMINVVNSEAQYTGCSSDYKPYIAFNKTTQDTISNTKTIIISKGAYNVDFFCKLISTQMSYVSQITPTEKQIPNTLLQQTGKAQTYEIDLYGDGDQPGEWDLNSKYTCILGGTQITYAFMEQFARGVQVVINFELLSNKSIGRSVVFDIAWGMLDENDFENRLGWFVCDGMDNFMFNNRDLNYKTGLSCALVSSDSNKTAFFQQGDKTKFFDYGQFSYLYGASQTGLILNSNSRFEFQFLHSPFYTAPSVAGTSLENGFVCPSLSGICLTNLEPESLWFDQLGFSRSILTSIKDLETKPDNLQAGYNITTGFIGTNSLRSDADGIGMKVPTTIENSQELTFPLQATKQYQGTLSSNEGFFIVEISSFFNNQPVINREGKKHNVIGIVSRNYVNPVSGIITGFGDGSVDFLVEKDMVIDSLRVRILDGSGNETSFIGNNHSIYLEIISE